MKLINEAQILETWAPMITESTGVTDPKKLKWMSQYAHFHSLNESQTAAGQVSYPNAGLMNVPGMGNVQPASQVAGGAGIFHSPSSTGSGDIYPSLLPLSLQVAAITVGFDIVKTVPMNGPTGVLPYMDYVYAGGKDPYAPGAVNADGYTDKPAVFSIAGVDVNAVIGGTAVKGDLFYFADDTGVADAGNTAIKTAYIGKSRVYGYPMFRILGEFVGTLTTVSDSDYVPFPQAVTLNDIFGTATTQVDNDPKIGSPTAVANLPELVSSFTDHVQGFAGAGPDDDQDWSGSFADGTANEQPMRRGVGEQSYPRTLGLKTFTKFVEAETYQITASITTEQIQDLNRVYGIDVIAMAENAMLNDISQSINRHILSRGMALGWSNNLQFLAAEGVNLNLNLSSGGDVATPAFIGMDEVAVAGTTGILASYGGFENQSTYQDRIVARCLAAGNVVAQRGRRGPATFIVTNLQLATSLQKVAQYSFAPTANTIDQTTGSLYPIGTVAGMTVYVDPNMAYGDNRVLVGRTGDVGMVFMPYLLAESVQSIAEGTGSTKIWVKSRYALVEAGFNPQTQYVTFVVTVPAGGIV